MRDLRACVGFLLRCYSDPLYGAACRPLLERFTPDNAKARALRIVAEAEHAEEMRARTRHRALADAEGLWWTWREIARRVEIELGQGD